MKCNASSTIGRRAFLQLSGLAAFGACLEVNTTARSASPPPTHVLQIREAQVEFAPGRFMTTMTYNGRMPGPLLRAAVGQPVRVDVYNHSSTPEWVSWPGQTLELSSAEEGVPELHSGETVRRGAKHRQQGIPEGKSYGREAGFIPAKSMRRLEFTPRRPGLHLYHSGALADSPLRAGLYSGQVGALLVEAPQRVPHYDREWVLMLKDCKPFLRRTRRGFEVDYEALSLNGRPPGTWTMRPGERVLVHVLNASATEPYSVALARHALEVVALDGMPVTPAKVEALQLSPGESASVIVEVRRTAGWVLQRTESRLDYALFSGLSLEGVEGVKGPQGSDGTQRSKGTQGFNGTQGSSGPGGLDGRANGVSWSDPVSDAPPVQTFSMVLARQAAARSGFSHWLINDHAFSIADPHPMFRLRRGLRHRLAIHNTTDEIIPIRLQHHRLELVATGSAPVFGIPKDVIAIGPDERVTVEFVADNPGPALFHCTRQLHRAFGLMALFDYA